MAERDLGIARLLDVEGKTVCATYKEWGWGMKANYMITLGGLHMFMQD